jgi:hypothetical protein
MTQRAPRTQPPKARRVGTKVTLLRRLLRQSPSLEYVSFRNLQMKRKLGGNDELLREFMIPRIYSSLAEEEEGEIKE